MSRPAAAGAEPPFREARRELTGLTARVEAAILRRLVPRVPSALAPDHLTALALVSMIAGGLLYWRSGRQPVLLHAVNACLLLNWLGDSLDGAVAKYRGRARPRYGFYVDHILDNVGVAALLGGLSLSGHINPLLGGVVLVLYLLLQLHMHMTAYTLGVFRLSFGGFGGTEMRLLLVGANLVAERRVYDSLALVAAAGLLGSLAVAIVRTAINLRRQDR